MARIFHLSCSDFNNKISVLARVKALEASQHERWLDRRARTGPSKPENRAGHIIVALTAKLSALSLVVWLFVNAVIRVNNGIIYRTLD